MEAYLCVIELMKYCVCVGGGCIQEHEWMSICEYMYMCEHSCCIFMFVCAERNIRRLEHSSINSD